MDFSAIIPWVPKLAATLLIVLGILIVLEIRAMLRKKNIASSQALPTEPVQVTKVRFPDTGIHTEAVQTTPIPTGYKKLLITVPFVLVGLFVLVHYLSGQANNPQDTTPAPTRSQTPINVSVYRFGEAGDLELLNASELKALEPSTEIIIAAMANETIQQATFTVNGEELEANMQDRTPNGEVFVSYILKPGVVDYHISVKLK